MPTRALGEPEGAGDRLRLERPQAVAELRGERGALLAAGLLGPTGALLAWRTLRDLDVRLETAPFCGWVGLIGALDRLLATPATDEP